MDAVAGSAFSIDSRRESSATTAEYDCGYDLSRRSSSFSTSSYEISQGSSFYSGPQFQHQQQYEVIDPYAQFVQSPVPEPSFPGSLQCTSLPTSLPSHLYPQQHRFGSMDSSSGHRDTNNMPHYRVFSNDSDSLSDPENSSPVVHQALPIAINNGSCSNDSCTASDSGFELPTSYNAGSYHNHAPAPIEISPLVNGHLQPLSLADAGMHSGGGAAAFGPASAELRSPNLPSSGEFASPKRVYIPPPASISTQYPPYYSNNGGHSTTRQATAPPPASSTAGSSSTMPSATSSVGSYSTHNPPTPGPESAPAQTIEFGGKSTFSPMEASSIAYGQPPQTAPLPFTRRSSADDAPAGFPHHHQYSSSASSQHFGAPPMSAHPTMLSQHFQYAHYPYGPSRHPFSSSNSQGGGSSGSTANPYGSMQSNGSNGSYFSDYAAGGSSGECEYDQSNRGLPPPSAAASVYSSSYPLSPFDYRTPYSAGALGGSSTSPPSSSLFEYGKQKGHQRTLPPIRTHQLQQQQHALGEEHEDEDEEFDGIPSTSYANDYSSPKISAAAAARLLDPAPMNPTMNLDDEVKTIEAASGATAFVSKLWFLLSQPQEFGEYIRWTAKGKGFILSHHSPTFGVAILSRFFRHSNVASFIRQLNLYKMVRMSQLALLEDLNDSGGRIDGELTHTGFSHPHLQRGHPELLHRIKPQSGRKKGSKKDAKNSQSASEQSPILTSTSPGKKNRTFSQPVAIYR